MASLVRARNKLVRVAIQLDPPNTIGDKNELVSVAIQLDPQNIIGRPRCRKFFFHAPIKKCTGPYMEGPLEAMVHLHETRCLEEANGGLVMQEDFRSHNPSNVKLLQSEMCSQMRQCKL